MTFNFPSFFAGIAAAIGILTVGFGGGVMMSGMLSGADGSRAPSKIERQVRESVTKEQKDIKPATEPTPVAPAREASTTVTAAAATPAPQMPAAASAPTPPASTAPLPAAPVQPPAAPPPGAARQAQAPQAPAPQVTTTLPPPIGAEKPVALTQPQADQLQPGVTRGEIARLKAQQRREERARRREEWRKQMAERWRQDDLRRQQQQDEQRAATMARPRSQDADEEDGEDLRPVVRPRPVFPFRLF